MPALVSRVVRTLFKQEVLPERLLWWFVAEATGEWAQLLGRDLAEHLGGRGQARSVLSRLAAPMLRRRAAALGVSAGDAGLAMGALYRVATHGDVAWFFEALGGAPRTLGEHARAERLIAKLSPGARWREVSCHLGELLIALTDGLPAHMPRARVVLGDICFAAGVRFSKKMRKAWALGDSPDEALEVLRMSEYIYRVNPEHWSATDAEARTGFLEGTACPWYTAEGWNGGHCGIFGQFQSGITAAFGLRYQLTTTIPKHGGRTCRIDVKPLSVAPIALRRKAAEAAL